MRWKFSIGQQESRADDGVSNAQVLFQLAVVMEKKSVDLCFDGLQSVSGNRPLRHGLEELDKREMRKPVFSRPIIIRGNISMKTKTSVGSCTLYVWVFLLRTTAGCGVRGTGR